MSNAADLPELWQRAIQREREGAAVGNDPAPERKAGRLLAVFIATGLVFVALPGTFLGVWNLFTIASHRSSAGASAAWIQSHGQAQLFGWIGTFILGISLYLLPKVTGRFVTRFRLAWIAWALWTIGIAWRWWSGVGGRQWQVGLVATAAFELAAFVLIQYVLWFRGRATRQRKPIPWNLLTWLAATGFAALGVALVLNLGISIQVALSGQFPAYPETLDRVFLTIALWGFAIPTVWGYTTRFVTTLAGLQPPVQRAAPGLALGVAVVVLLALSRYFVAANFTALALTIAAIWAVRVFERPAREPKRAGVYRWYPPFIRVAYSWLVVGAVLGVWGAVAPNLGGIEGASRHALTVGFMALMVFCVAPLILPAFMNGRELWSPRLMGLSLWFLAGGCLLRVSSEAIAYSVGGVAWAVLPISAVLELCAVSIFVLDLAMTVAQPMPAWFNLSGVTPNIPLYYFVTSYPGTKRLLIRNGLRALGKTRQVPRTLTLAEAAAADGADIDCLIRELRNFFAERQPRRTG